MGLPLVRVMIAAGVGAFTLYDAGWCEGDTPILSILRIAAVVAFPLLFVWAASSVGQVMGYDRGVSILYALGVYAAIGVVLLVVALAVHGPPSSMGEAVTVTIVGVVSWSLILSDLLGTVPDCGN